MARCKMSPCDAIDARLADLPDLGDETRIDLERHAETCQSCRAKLAEYRALMAVMAALRHFEAPLHVDGERLTRFAIHRAAPTEPDHDQMRLSGVEIQQIEGHVRTCPRCRLAVDSILEQYREVDIFLAEAGVPPLPIIKPSSRVSLRLELERAWMRAKKALVSIPPYPTAGVALGCLLIVLLWMGPWLRDPYHQLAFVEATETSFLTRDSGSALTGGISLMNEGRYSEALTLLEQFSAGDSDARLVTYAHYLSGFALLCEAKTEVFGRVLAYSGPRLDRAIEHLRIVTESGQSMRLREDAFWLLGKAELMKREPARALEALREVEQIEGRRAREARELIEAVRAVEG